MDLKSLSVVIVDDDEQIGRLLEKTFAGARSVSRYRAPGEFLAGARLDGCDIVLMDINMPGGMDGIDLTRHIKLASPQCDVIVMTGDPTLDNAMAAIKAGAYDFVKKPFTADSIESSVARCMEKRAMSSELRMIKAAQEELAAAYSQLKSSERVKEAFLSVIGHELRTPLTKILAGAELLRATVKGEDEVLNAVAAGAGDLQETIESLILYADLRKEARPAGYGHVDLKELAREVVDELAPKAAAAGVTLSLKCSEADAAVAGEPLWIRNAVKRLALNAVTFNVKGGTAEVLVEGGPVSAAVTVADSGIGIPPELVAGFGTPFYQVAEHMTRKTGGLGLGLAIVKQVVEAHSGLMSVESRAGGTAFKIIFRKTPPDGKARLPG